MNKEHIIKNIRLMANELEPYIHAHQPNALQWDGVSYKKTEEVLSPDPYALAWWSVLRTLADLLEIQETEISAKQKEYLNKKLFGGMGSFNDFWFDAKTLGDKAASTNHKLDQLRKHTFELLNAKANI